MSAADLTATEAAAREAAVADYTSSIDRLAAGLAARYPEWTEAGSVLAAQQILGKHLGDILTEAAGRVRAARGLPEPVAEPEPEEGAEEEEYASHGERGRAEGLRTLQAHDGVEDPDLDDLEYLLVDLMHWCGDAGAFDEILEGARSQFEAEREEDAADAPPEEEETPEAHAKRIRDAMQMRMLHSHKPQRFDA